MYSFRPVQFKLVSFKGQLYFLLKNTVSQTGSTQRTWFGIPFTWFHKHFSVLQRVITVAAILNMLSMLYDNLHNYSVITGNFYCF